jgi:hypothetical protein
LLFFCGSLRRGLGADEMNDQSDDREDEQQMDHYSGDVINKKTANPEGEQYYEQKQED